MTPWFAAALLVLACAACVAAYLGREARLRRALSDARARLPGADHAQKDIVRGIGLLAQSACAEIAAQRAALENERSVRSQRDEQLREAHERYALAVAGANDGMWEWNLRTGAAWYSPRWKAMLGCEESEVAHGIDEWRARIHPDDAPATWRALEAHLAGRSERFHDEHRLRHRSGAWRWVLVRASAVRQPDGRAVRLVGLNTDVTGRRLAQQALLEVADGLAEHTGGEAYRALVHRFASVMGVREAFLCECVDQPATRVRVLAHWDAGAFRESEEYALADTPCERVIAEGRPLVVIDGADERWASERQAGVRAYLGLPCLDSGGAVIGHIACQHGEPLPGDLPHEAILKLFAVRASVEIERSRILRRAVAGRPVAALH